MSLNKAQHKSNGVLYVVATPIGNLEDITIRAQNTLRETSVIAAEDTRRTRKLLTHLGISKKIISCREHNENQCASTVIDILTKGKDVAYVTDAGTPALSDPGARLVSRVWEKGFHVAPVPGVSALTAALSASGLSGDSFLFKGFLPSRKAQRENALSELIDVPETIIFFESPKRIIKTLASILKILGDRTMVLAREMTKAHETIIHGKTSEIIKRLPDAEIKGEITVVMEGEKTGEIKRTPTDEDALEKALKFLTTRNKVGVKEAAAILSKLLNLPKKIIYEIAVKQKSGDC
jgi:16S rRNA (cytidine1402-2'-O)-methyltransferase